MPKPPSTHVPTKTHNRKEDKTSWIVFFKNPSSYWKFSLPKDTHLLTDHSVYMAQNFGILFPIVPKKAKELTHSRENLKHICLQKLITKKIHM